MAKGFNINSMVINRAIDCFMLDKATGEQIFYANQIKEPKLAVGGEQVKAEDALGQIIATFDRSKTASLECSNALFSFDLVKAQLGAKKEVASDSSKIVTPSVELIELKDKTKCKLEHKPVTGSLKYIYSTFPDRTADKMYKLGSGSATADTFVIGGADGKEITLPTTPDAFNVGDKIIAIYDYEATKAVKVTNRADVFGKGGKFVLRVLAADVCDTNTEYLTYIIFGNAKLKNDFDLTIGTTAEHGLSVEAIQDYCAATNDLFSIIVAGDE